MKLKDKKGMSQTWWILGTALVTFIIVIIVILFFRQSGTKAFDEVDNKLDSFGDCDDDKVADLFDKCPCNEGDAQNDGCPDGETGDSLKAMKKSVSQCGKDGLPKCVKED